MLNVINKEQEEDRTQDCALGTPEETDTLFDISPSRTTVWVRSSRKCRTSEIQLTAFIQKDVCVVLYQMIWQSPLWGCQSDYFYYENEICFGLMRLILFQRGQNLMLHRCKGFLN